MTAQAMSSEEIEAFKAVNAWTRLTVIFFGGLHRPPRVLDLTNEEARDLTFQQVNERRTTLLGPMRTLDGSVISLNWNGIEETRLEPIGPSRREICGEGVDGGQTCGLPKGHPGAAHLP